jgi:hypothetical protein
MKDMCALFLKGLEVPGIGVDLMRGASRGMVVLTPDFRVTFAGAL